MRGESNVPDALKFCSMPGPVDIGIITDTASFFSDDVYKIVAFLLLTSEFNCLSPSFPFTKMFLLVVG